MKVAITSVTLLLCVATAVAKPAQDIPKCLKEAWPDFATVDQPCFKTISDLDIVPEEENAIYLESLCTSTCITKADDYIKEKCGVSFGAQYCSKDPVDQKYCFSTYKKFYTFGELWNAFYSACYGKDCNDPACNAAIQKVSCCAKQEEKYYAEVVQGSIPFPVPGNCMLPEECVPMNV